MELRYLYDVLFPEESVERDGDYTLETLLDRVELAAEKDELLLHSTENADEIEDLEELYLQSEEEEVDALDAVVFSRLHKIKRFIDYISDNKTELLADIEKFKFEYGEDYRKALYAHLLDKPKIEPKRTEEEWAELRALELANPPRDF